MKYNFDVETVCTIDEFIEKAIKGHNLKADVKTIKDIVFKESKDYAEKNCAALTNYQVADIIINYKNYLDDKRPTPKAKVVVPTVAKPTVEKPTKTVSKKTEKPKVAKPKAEKPHNNWEWSSEWDMEELF